MPERIRQLSVAVPPKHVLHGCLRGRSGGKCLFEGGIHVFDIEKNAHRSPVQSLRRPRAHLWDLVGEHDDGIANLDLSVHDLAARAGHAEAFKGTEGALVKVKSACGVSHHQIGSHRVETFWNGLHFSWHISSSLDLGRSEEHTSELQSRLHLVCRLLLEKKKEIYPAPRYKSSTTSMRAASPPPYGG